MKTITLTEIEAINESTAVAAGKIVLAAHVDAKQVMIGDNDLTEDAFREMVAYLGRRGVTVRYDHDAGYPVSTSA